MMRSAVWLGVVGLALTGQRGTVPRSDFRVSRSSLLTIARLHYDGGGDWYANPSSLPNLLTAIRTRTGLAVADRERVRTLTGPKLWDGPYLSMTGSGNAPFSTTHPQNPSPSLDHC